MFSLILTIVALVLVAALALFVYFFGSDIAGQYHTRAAASTLVTEAQQIAGAGTLATTDGVGWPAAAPYFSQPYLSTMPTPAAGAYTPEAGVPSPQDWTYLMAVDPATRPHHFILAEKIRREVCMEVNRQQGFIGIPAAWDGTSIIQCYGTGSNATKGYTFLYDPPSTSPDVNQAALDQIVTAAGAAASPGYPRLCPDGTTLATAADGVCQDTKTTTPAAAPATAGFWVFQASVPGDWYDPSIQSMGFSATCPAGGVNPNSAQATPVVNSSAEPYNVDGVADMRWWDPNSGNWYPLGSDLLTRVWCLPANPGDVDPAWAAPSVSYNGALKNVHLYPDRAGVNPTGSGTYVTSTRATVTAGGVTWSMAALIYEADLTDTNNPSQYAPFIDGRKVVIGRGGQADQTYYDNTPANPWYAEVQSSFYGRESGIVVMYSAPPPPPPYLYGASPSSGPVDGGTTVALNGGNLRAGDIVYFNGVAANVLTTDTNQLIVTAPKGAAAGYVTVSVYDPSLAYTTNLNNGFQYTEDPLKSSVCSNIGQNGPNMEFSPSGAQLLQMDPNTLMLTANSNGEIPVRVQTYTSAGREQEGFDKYLSTIQGARIDGTPVPSHTSLVSATNGMVQFDAWIPASAVPTNHVPTVELQSSDCGGYVTVSSFTDFRPQLIPLAADECATNLSRTPGHCTTTTVNNQTGDLIATDDWWLRGVFWTQNQSGQMTLNTSILSSAGDSCVPRAWEAWWWADSTKTSGYGAGWVECSALYSETRRYAGNYLNGVGAYNGIYVYGATADVNDFYARGGTQVPYLNGKQNWRYGGQFHYNYPFTTRDWAGAADCQWGGCVNGLFMRYGTVSEFNAYVQAVQSSTGTQNGTSIEALASYACVTTADFYPANNVKDASGNDVSAQVSAHVQNSSCYQMLNNNKVPPLQ